MASQNVVNVTDDTFEQTVVKSNLPVLVDFWAPWCGPCQMVGPIVEELATEYQGRAKVVKINVDESPGVAGQFGIRSIPTVMVFKNGKVNQTMVGARPKTEFAKMLDSALV